jgi:hypothetical protein
MAGTYRCGLLLLLSAALAGVGASGCASGECDEEVCDGVDNNCDGVIDEVCTCAGDEMQSCYPGDPDNAGVGECARGTQACASGEWGDCEGAVLPAGEVCDGLDNDCNGMPDDGIPDTTCGVGNCETTVPGCEAGAPVDCVPGEASVTEECDGADDDCDGEVDEDCDCTDDDVQDCYTGTAGTRGVGECQDGTQTCSGGTWGSCEGDVTPIGELCNGLDDNCDGTSDDGDPGGGGSCDTGMPGACAAGTNHCVSTTLTCVADTTPMPDVCNGIDDDCNPSTPDGADDSAVGVACDGPDSDLCAGGTTVCTGTVVCNDSATSLLDICNGIDDDCDPASADGTEDPLNGAGCDGADSDLCIEGVYSCAAGGLVCSDTTGSTLDVCDGIDNDCDPASADGSEDPLLGTGCDGPDSDLCEEGTWSCSGGGLVCSDATGSTTDVCDGIDNDCDPASPDGSEDPAVGGACDGADLDLCLEGTWSCSGGSLVCSDTTPTSVEACNAADDDCDGSVDETFVRNDNPLCTSGTFYLGAVSGDTGAGVLTDSWRDEEWDRFTLVEDSSSSIYISATISLTSPPGTDYDLYVYCASCGGTLAGSSTLGGTTGHTDTVQVRANDEFAIDDTIDIIVEVRHFSSTVCAFWDLQVTGNTSVSTTTCN